MIELRHLRYFLAVAEELNFTRAAERLHMAQPPLSVAIRQLEDELGTQVLTRTTRDVHLTEAGAAFLAGARSTLAELDRSVDAARRAASGEVGRVRVGFSWGARFVTLPAIGRAIQEAHPDLTLLTQEMWNARMPEALRDGLIDIAIAVCPEVSGGLAYERIRAEPLVVLVGAGHRLAAAPDVSLEKLRDDSFLMFPRELAPRFYDLLVAACRRAGFEPTVGNDSFHTNWELGLLEDPSLVALVPASVSTGIGEGVVALRLTAPEPIETVLVWREGAASPAAEAFREAARAATD